MKRREVITRRGGRVAACSADPIEMGLVKMNQMNRSAALCELVAGTTLEITLPDTHRWIPKSMKINYLAKATTDVRARTALDLATWPEAGSVNVRVEVVNTENANVAAADIEMYISRRK